MAKLAMKLLLVGLVTMPCSTWGTPNLGRRIFNGVLEGGERSWKKRQAAKERAPQPQPIVVNNSGVYITGSQDINAANNGSSVHAIRGPIVVACDGERYDIARMARRDLQALEARLEEIKQESSKQIEKLGALEVRSYAEAARQSRLEKRLRQVETDLSKVAGILSRHMTTP